ncbi:MAG: hypothetical protein JWM86_2065 [Thermoleophilia bacterium]|nr:hypothetical protein [Thermoleophilia bacterium]
MRPHRSPISLVLLVLAMAGVTGCGTDAKQSATASDSGAGAGTLVHVDGMVTVEPKGFSLVPVRGGDSIEFRLGPAIKPNEVQAFDAADSVARVTYRLTEDEPIAVAIKSPPALGEGLDEYVGSISDVSSKEITIKGASGERTFTIDEADSSAFDQPHLKDHERAGTAVRVFYRDKDTAVAYEDA